MMKILETFPPFLEITNNIDYGKPNFLGIHLPPICNFRCRKCFIGEQKKLFGLRETLSIEEIDTILKSGYEAGVKILGLTGAGEPFLHPEIKLIISQARELGFLTHIPTNMSVLNEGLVDFLKNNGVTLVLSLDSIDKNRYVHLTQTDEKMFEKVLDNLQMAQEIYRGTKRNISIKGNDVEVYRIAVHATIHESNTEEIENISRLIQPDTLLSLSSIAYVGNARFDVSLQNRQEVVDKLSEEHIVRCKNEETNEYVCGFYKYGLDINFDGQLLLDAHAIETRGLFLNIRDFHYNIRSAFTYLTPFKKLFVFSGFCPVRSPEIDFWIKNMEAIQKEEKEYTDIIVEDIRMGNPLLKYAYIGLGAAKFLSATNDPDYKIYQKGHVLLEKYFDIIESSLTKNIVVLGVGDGSKLVRLLNHKKPNEVTLVDISNFLLNTTEKRIGKAFFKVNADFEQYSFHEYPAETTFLMLGSTIFNLFLFKKFLKRLKHEIPRGKLILGAEFLSDHTLEKQEVLMNYTNTTGIKFTFHPLEILGFTSEDGQTKITFNNSLKRVEHHFVFNSRSIPKRIQYGLEPIEKVLLSVSAKPDVEHFKDELNKLNIKVGFDLYVDNYHKLELFL